MDTADIEVFLTLSEELHFRRTAERLFLTQSRVSRVIVALERHVGGKLFERTSREVRLTPLGTLLRDRLQPAYAQLQSAFDGARRAAQETAGVVRIGFTLTTQGPMLTRLATEFEANYPGGRAVLCEVDVLQPYAALRRGEVDVLLNWLAVDEPDLTVGPAVAYRERVLAVGVSHPLAKRRMVRVEELADYAVAGVHAALPTALLDAILPARTPSGRPIQRTHFANTHDMIAEIVTGRAIHPTMTGVVLLRRSDVVLVPIEDMRPLALGLIWCTAHDNSHVRQLVATATSIRRRATGARARH